MDASWFNGSDEREFSAPEEPHCGDPECGAEPNEPCMDTCECPDCLRRQVESEPAA